MEQTKYNTYRPTLCIYEHAGFLIYQADEKRNKKTELLKFKMIMVEEGAPKFKNEF